jgi:redox-sensitive bicupin YhaK (pirin superfamily)
MTAPRYQDVTSDAIPEVTDDDGRACGLSWATSGETRPVEGIAADPRYLDVSVPPGVRKRIPVEIHDRHSPMSSKAAARSVMPPGRRP